MAGALPFGDKIASPLPAQEQVSSVHVSQWALSWNRFRRQKRGLFGIITLVLLVAAVIIVPMLSPFGVETPSGGVPFEPAASVDHQQPGKVHWLGTDVRSRDELVRLAYGGRLSLSLALLSTAALVIVGVVIGAVAGVYGGWVDTALMRLADFMLALPLLPMYVIAIKLFTTFTPRGAHIDVVQEMAKIGFVFVLFGWMGISRLVRGSILTLRSRSFVEAARALGSSNRQILFKHLLPNSLAPVIVAATFAVGDLIIWESVLAYLSQGIEEFISPTWGNMAAAAEFFLDTLINNPNPFQEIRGYMLLLPVVLIFITVLSCNYIGDALRDALDPRLS
jgi:peptide/nickel transport system permease protein